MELIRCWAGKGGRSHTKLHYSNNAD